MPEILQWDSSFFGYSVCKVHADRLSKENFDDLIRSCKQQAIKLSYIFVEPDDEISGKTLADSNVSLVDKKITFQLSNLELENIYTDIHIEKFPENYPSKRLFDLSLQSGAYSRFKIDKNFKSNEFERLFKMWVENSVSGKIADNTLVYKQDGIELGFITLKAFDDLMQIGLLAVDSEATGKSIGKKLVYSVIAESITRGKAFTRVVTQSDNIVACNFYRAVGFKTLKVENIYHLWL